MEVLPKLLSSDRKEIIVGQKAYEVGFDESGLHINTFTITDINYQTASIKIVQDLPKDNTDFTTDKIKFVSASQLFMDLQNILDEMIRNLIYYRDIFVPEKISLIAEEYKNRFGKLDINDEKFQVNTSIDNNIKI